MKKDWIVFANRETAKEIAAVTLDGFTRSELKPTIELLASENDLKTEEITYRLEER